MSKEIKWNTGIPVVREVEFTSGNWHLTQKNGEMFFLTNFDILCTPVGHGATEKETFENMLQSIGEFEERLKNIKQEIRDHIKKISDGEKNA